MTSLAEQYVGLPQEISFESAAEADSAVVRIEVPFHDLDPAGYVWHGNYAKYLELARCALRQRYDFQSSTPAALMPDRSIKFWTGPHSGHSPAGYRSRNSLRLQRCITFATAMSAACW